MAEALWGSRQRVDPVNAVQVRVSRLRRQLRAVAGPAGAALVQTRPGGYELVADHVWTDARAYEAALVPAAESKTIEAYDRAEAIWRGEPFSDVPMTICLAAEAPACRNYGQELWRAAPRRPCEQVDRRRRWPPPPPF